VGLHLRSTTDKRMDDKYTDGRVRVFCLSRDCILEEKSWK